MNTHSLLWTGTLESETVALAGIVDVGIVVELVMVLYPASPGYSVAETMKLVNGNNGGRPPAGQPANRRQEWGSVSEDARQHEACPGLRRLGPSLSVGRVGQDALAT